MAITRTKYLKIINADKGDDIPAGTKTDAVTPVNDLNNSGRNGDMQKIDEAIGVGHNPDGSHKTAGDAPIGGANCIQTGASAVVDETTLEFSGNKIRVKANSIGTNELAVDAATSAEIAPAFKATGRQIYSNTLEAGTGDGAAAPAATEWQETGTSPVQKVRFFVRKTSADTKCKLVCDAKTTSGTWQVRLNFAATVAAATGTNTTYAASPEVVIEVDITGFTNDDVFEVRIELNHVEGTGTARMLAPIVTVTQD